MNKPLIKKFFGGAASGALVTLGAFVAEKCGYSDLKQFGVAIALAIGSGLFHYVKNWFPIFIDALNKSPKPPEPFNE